MASAGGISRTQYDVVIVGFGPVGAVAAALLGSGGISTLVVDRLASIYDKPRAVALDHEIARLLQNIGLADALEGIIAPFSASEYYGVDGQLIKRLDMLPPPFPLSWTPSMVFMQPALEDALRKRVSEIGCVDVALGCELMALHQDDGVVTAHLVSADGQSKVVQARYAIGCDGASSTVRKSIGIGFDDLDFDQPWLVVDLVANARGLAKLPAVSAQHCNPERPTSYIVCTGAHRRWEIMLDPAEDPQRMAQPEEVWRLLSRWIGPEDGHLWRAASYRFHALIAQSWRDRGVLIAGDAAHQQPPFLGQGLCQGVRDAANLAWKLRRVLEGSSSERILDTYQSERAPHVAELIRTIKGIGGLVSERDVDRARARDARLLAEAGGVVRSQPRQDLMPSLKSGCLGRAGQARGTLFPQPMVRTANGPVRMDDAIGVGLRLVMAPSGPELPEPLRARFERLGGHIVTLAEDRGHAETIVEEDDVLAAWFNRHRAMAAVVRPDHYVFDVIETPAAFSDTIAMLEAALG